MLHLRHCSDTFWIFNLTVTTSGVMKEGANPQLGCLCYDWVTGIFGIILIRAVDVWR